MIYSISIKFKEQKDSAEKIKNEFVSIHGTNNYFTVNGIRVFSTQVPIRMFGKAQPS